MEDFRTKFQSVALRANDVLIFFANLKAFRFFKSTGVSFQRTDAEKATVCFPMLVRSFGLYKFCLEAYLVLLKTGSLYNAIQGI